MRDSRVGLLAAGDETHAAFGRRSIPAEPLRKRRNVPSRVFQVSRFNIRERTSYIRSRHASPQRQPLGIGPLSVFQFLPPSRVLLVLWSCRIAVTRSIASSPEQREAPASLNKPFTPVGLAQTIYRQRPILTSMDTR